ncbi:MAG TPA: DUF309 domain-containing protein [Verrucomicrobia bacterium]|nr:DUF309 domain-containing protein [Verrucomicrobiota bacterium]HOP98979.1 DUF309 domain-containing protein [Verrucomicrobiota bacterium]HPU57142.1 DUF309 domain-containing protein [Verrucomicrobiota bacterium]
MSKKSEHIAARIRQFEGRGLDPHYLGYFDCFNQRLYFEAHDVLEELWLQDRHGANGNFYKGLIQLAGAFVHLQKGRLRPAVALFRLAEANLRNYAPMHERLNVGGVLELIEIWVRRVEQGEENPLQAGNAPALRLEG